MLECHNGRQFPVFCGSHSFPFDIPMMHRTKPVPGEAVAVNHLDRCRSPELLKFDNKTVKVIALTFFQWWFFLGVDRAAENIFSHYSVKRGPVQTPG
jgi:hypothetical protein